MIGHDKSKNNSENCAADLHNKENWTCACAMQQRHMFYILLQKHSTYHKKIAHKLQRKIQVHMHTHCVEGGHTTSMLDHIIQTFLKAWYVTVPQSSHLWTHIGRDNTHYCIMKNILRFICNQTQKHISQNCKWMQFPYYMLPNMPFRITKSLLLSTITYIVYLILLIVCLWDLFQLWQEYY